jgi:hypothetical protein
MDPTTIAVRAKSDIFLLERLPAAEFPSFVFWSAILSLSIKTHL